MSANEKTIVVNEDQWVRLQENLITFGSAMREIAQSSFEADMVRKAVNTLIKTGLASTFLADELVNPDE